MKPEAEVKRLIDMFLKVIKDRTDVFNAYTDLSFAKECALICAERSEELVYTMDYWQQVKKIISEPNVHGSVATEDHSRTDAGNIIMGS